MSLSVDGVWVDGMESEFCKYKRMVIYCNFFTDDKREEAQDVERME